MSTVKVPRPEVRITLRVSERWPQTSSRTLVLLRATSCDPA